MLRTRITENFGIQYPIMSAPMGMHSSGKLAAAVSNAGALGMFGGTNPGGPDWLRSEIRTARELTDRPIGVGFITHLFAVFPTLVEIAVEENVPLVGFSFADPSPYAERVKAVGGTVICQVQSMRHAREAMACGADILVAQGNEAGGHTGTMALLPLLTQVIDAHPQIPVLAAGGIATPRSLAAVLAAGADGAWLGTAFLATPEAIEVSDAYKKIIIAASSADTEYTSVFDLIETRFFGIPDWPEGIAARMYRNEMVKEWHGRDAELRQQIENVLPRFAAARERQDTEGIAIYMGQSASAIEEIRPAADVLHTICNDAERILRERRSLLP